MPSRNNDHLKFGKKGEKKAVEYLIAKGYQILYTNYRYRRGEVDIIAEKGNFTVFVEVKSRTNTDYGNPEEAVDKKKEDLIKKVASDYMDNHIIRNLIRFDIISIIQKPEGKIEIVHFKDAF